MTLEERLAIGAARVALGQVSTEWRHLVTRIGGRYAGHVYRHITAPAARLRREGFR